MVIVKKKQCFNVHINVQINEQVNVQINVSNIPNMGWGQGVLSSYVAPDFPCMQKQSHIADHHLAFVCSKKC